MKRMKNSQCVFCRTQREMDRCKPIVWFLLVLDKVSLASTSCGIRICKWKSLSKLLTHGYTPVLFYFHCHWSIAFTQLIGFIHNICRIKNEEKTKLYYFPFYKFTEWIKKNVNWKCVLILHCWIAKRWTIIYMDRNQRFSLSNSNNNKKSTHLFW